MKRKVIAVIACIILSFCLVVNASASAVTKAESDIEYFSDGSYATTDIVETANIVTRGTLYDKSADKVYTYRDAKGNEQYKITLHGKFRVNSGVSSTCTEATVKVEITNDDWKVISQSAWPSGSQAIASVTLKRYLLFIPVDTIEKTLTLTCDKYGNLT